MQTILTVNGGSSSLKCALYKRANDKPELLYSFALSNILKDAGFKVRNAEKDLLENSQPNFSSIPDNQRHQACLETVLGWLDKQIPDSQLSAIGHRVVHGGEIYSKPCLIDEDKMRQLAEFIPLAPLHQPYNLKLVEACRKLAPELPQVACFDTMFHTTQSELEQSYALPDKYTKAGIHRYGFHGLSYEYIQRQLNKMDSGQMNSIVCHLGAGASMCAIKAGKSIASSMGFTAVDGLPMGSRTGNIDPGVLLHLQQHYDMTTKDLENLIYKQSGWLGVSGISSDMLELHNAKTPEAEKAIEMFAYRVALEIGRLTATLEGLEQLVFTGGVGENDADVRARVLNRCHWLGLKFSKEANQVGEPIISLPESKVQVRIIPTNEEAMIATHVQEVTG